MNSGRIYEFGSGSVLAGRICDEEFCWISVDRVVLNVERLEVDGDFAYYYC